MGNSFACFTSNHQTQRSSKSSKNGSPIVVASTTTRGRRVNISSSSSRSSTKECLDDTLIRQQALAAAFLFCDHHQQNGSLPSIDRSVSVQYSLPSSKKSKKCQRSSSSRPRSLSDSLPQPHQLLNKDMKLDGLETRHFVLVHGGGFGAWCWYKTITLLEESGYEVDAINLTGSGVHSYDTNNITSLSQYTAPLTDFLQKLGDGEKVILVGHDFGGTCISYAMELYPRKVSKAVYIAAAMLTSGHSTLSMFSQQTSSNDLMKRAHVFLYGNGKDNPPTAIDIDKTLLGDLLFNKSPAKDVALASVSMRPIPFTPIMEKLYLSKPNYGSVRRFYIKTQEDFAISIPLQEAMINSNPPEQVFQLKGSDHSPFFSRPQALHRVLAEISKIP